MIELISNMTFWHWFILGSALMIIEMLVPSTLFLWPGVSAIIIGVAKLAVPSLTWPVAVTAWGLLSVVTVVAWLQYRRKNPPVQPDNGLNQRGQHYVGQVFILTKPLENGKGEVKVGDSVWMVSGGTPLPAGEKVKVTGVDGSVLKVEQA